MSTPFTNAVTLFIQGTEASGNYNQGIPLYIKSDETINNFLPLFIKNEYLATQRGLKLYIKNADGVTDGAINFSASIPLYIARDTESVAGYLPLYLRVIEGEINSYIPLYISGSNPVLDNSLNLFLYNTQGSGNNNLKLYTHGF